MLKVACSACRVLLFIVATIVLTAFPIVAPNPAEASFSGTNGRIAYSTDGFGIYVVNTDGTNNQRIDSGQPGNNFNPTWSPDGKKIAFATTRDGQVGLYVMDASGANPKRVTVPANAVNDYDPSWSPDCKQLAFQRRSQGSGVYVVNIDGTGLNFVWDSGSEPVFSPDGNRVAYAMADSGSSFGIVVINVDGSNRHVLNPSTKYSSNVPAWSPDGTRIAYEYSNTSPSPSIWTMKADGSGQHQVAQVGTEPAWSPDGKLILFAKPVNNGEMLETIRTDGTGETPIPGPITGRDPDWQSVGHGCSKPSATAPPRTAPPPKGAKTAPRSPTETARVGQTGSAQRGPLETAKHQANGATPSVMNGNQAQGAPFSGVTSTPPNHHGRPIWPLATGAAAVVVAGAGSLIYFRRFR